MSTDYDPKHKKHARCCTPFRSVLKIVCTLLFCGGLLLAEKKLVKKDATVKKPPKITTTKSSTTSAALTTHTTTTTTNMPVENIHQAVDRLQQQQKSSPTQQKSAESVATKDKASLPLPVMTSDATEEFPEDAKPTSNPGLAFSVKKPVIVLSLPHNGDLAVARYFKCGGVAPQEMGKYWTHSSLAIGRCLHQNLMHNATMTYNCGDFAVWSELQFIQPAKTKGKTKFSARCFDPVLFPGSLDQLYEALPQAFVLIVKQDPLKWYMSLPKDLKAHWKKWCNPSHMTLFPTSSHSKTKYLQFYQAYHDRLTTFITQHRGWTPIEIDLDQTDATTTGSLLQKHLNIPGSCWAQSVSASLKVGGDDSVVLPAQQRPNTISYPILSVALPKSGDSTANSYFKCGLGIWATAQQWTTPSKSTEAQPAQDVPIGKCIEDNVKFVENPTDNILKGCGHARVWGDIGYLRDKTNGGHCYYPTMEEGVLDKFAAYYPHATILHVIRPSQDWYYSASKFNNLPNRWSAAQNCNGFPPTGAPPEEWHAFYERHVQSMRDFAARHTNLTYIEIPLSKEGGDMLQDIYSFPNHCWPDIKDD